MTKMKFVPPQDHTDSVSSPEFNEADGYIDGHKICTSWNVFNKSGCQYEFLNPGRSCRFIHHCSICQANGVNFMPHKAWQCPDMGN